MRGFKTSLLLFLTLTFSSAAHADVTYNFGYSGRLSDKSGKPYDGPVALSISFFRAASGGTPLLTVTDGLSAVSLTDGIFQLNLTLAATDYTQVFSDVSQAVFVQVTDMTHAASAPFPRQQVGLIPYAAKVPVDTKTVVFNNEGQLALAAAGSATPGQCLSQDTNGNLIWATPAGASGNLAATGGTLTGALTISAGGESLSGGLNNNNGGITNVGTLVGVGPSLTGTGALAIAAGGAAQNLTLRSSTSGAVNLGSSNGTSLAVLDGGASTVDYITLKGATAGGSPLLSTAGADANINLAVTPKGTGSTIFASGSTTVLTVGPSSILANAALLAATGALTIGGNLGPNPGTGINLGDAFGYGAATGGNTDLVKSSTPFQPASGTGVFNGINLSNTINQTGGANGVTRGLYINPTLTSAADYRSIETTAGNVIFGGGNVGIGTASPAGALDVGGENFVVKGGTGVDNYYTLGVSIWGGQVQCANGQKYWVSDVGNMCASLNFTGPGTIVQACSSTPGGPVTGMHVDCAPLAGAVGVHTNNPMSMLDVAGGIAVGSFAGANAAPGDGLIVSGSVGIGTANPQGTLHLVSPGSSTYLVVGDKTNGHTFGYFDTSADVGGYFELEAFQSGGSPADVVISRLGGNVGIGTTSPHATLDVNGTLKLQVQASGASPACDGPKAGSLTLTSSSVLCICNGASWLTTTGAACSF